MKRNYEIISYDLWGNDKEGYEVNDAHSTGIVITIDDNEPDKAIINKLKKVDYLKKGIWTKNFEIDGEPGYSLYVNYKGNPFCELKYIEDCD